MPGTRFLATTESRAHSQYKQSLIEASAEDTVRTILFGYGWPNAPHRTLRTPFVNEWLGNEQQGQESRADEPVVGHTIIAGQEITVRRFMGMPPNSDSTGDIELRDLPAGQDIGLIHEIKSARDVVLDLVAGTRRILERSAHSAGRPSATTH